MAQGKVKELIEKYEEIRARKERLAKEKPLRRRNTSRFRLTLRRRSRKSGRIVRQMTASSTRRKSRANTVSGRRRTWKRKGWTKLKS